MHRLPRSAMASALMVFLVSSSPLRAWGEVPAPQDSVPGEVSIWVEEDVEPGVHRSLHLRSHFPHASFTVFESERPLDPPAVLAGTEFALASGSLDRNGKASVSLQAPVGELPKRCYYTAFVGMGPTAIARSKSLALDWSGGGSGGDSGQASATLSYSTRFGDSGNQSYRRMTTDEQGAVYIVSRVGPLVNAPPDADSGGVWIAKLDPSINGANGDASIVWTTYFGGTVDPIQLRDIVAANGFVFVSGWAISSTLALGNVFDTTKGVFRDGYVAMFDAATGRRLATTYTSPLASTSEPTTHPVAMHVRGDELYLGGTAPHENIWTTHGFADFDGENDAFLLKLRVLPPAGPGLLGGFDLVWGTRLPGGSGLEVTRAITTDGLGNVYAAGFTESAVAYPGTGFQSAKAGGQDAFVLRLLDGPTVQLAVGTYFGGGRDENVASVSVDVTGDVWIGGTTASSDMPVSAGAFDTALGGSSDAFLARFSPDLSSLVSASYFGGSSEDIGQGLVAHDGLVYLVGQTKSTDLPVVDPLPGHGTKGNREDAFLARLDSTGGPLFCTYFGGQRTDAADGGIEVDAAGTVYFGGQMDSEDVALTSPTSHPGNIYVAVVTFQPPPPAPEAPSMLVAQSTSSSTIDLTWVDGSLDESGFLIERSLDMVNWAVIASVIANTTNHTDVGLPAETTHHYRVVAFNAGGNSPPSNIASATTLMGAGGTLSLQSITPNSMQAGSSLTGVTISGAGFLPGATVSFAAGQGPAPEVSQVVVTATQISMNLSVGQGGPGGTRVWDVVVTNPNQGTATLPGGFAVVK